jgi:general secretion pathway protein K
VKLKKQKNRQGFALIAVLLLITALAAIILEFNYKSRMKLNLADNFYLSTRALNAADAGINVAMAKLGQKKDIHSDEMTDRFFSRTVQIPVGDDFCTISMVQESGKININSLSTSDSRQRRNIAEQLLRLIDQLNAQYTGHPPISYSIVAAMIDWVDADDDVTILSFVNGEKTGAENGYYRSLEYPYPCKNAPFEDLKELLLVKGMTNEIFYGRADSNDNAKIKPVDGIGQFLTIYGDGKININEASITVIQSISEKISLTLAQNIIAQRQSNRFSSIEQLQQVPGMTPEIYQSIREFITVKPDKTFYTVTSTGISEKFEQKVSVVLEKDEKTSEVNVIIRYEM